MGVTIGQKVRKIEGEWKKSKISARVTTLWEGEREPDPEERPWRVNDWPLANVWERSCAEDERMRLIAGFLCFFLLILTGGTVSYIYIMWGRATIINAMAIIIIIIITRPKPAYGWQGLAGSWGQDTDEVSTFLVFLTSHFAPAALSSDLTNLGPLMAMKIHLETLKNHGNQPKTIKNH